MTNSTAKQDHSQQKNTATDTRPRQIVIDQSVIDNYNLTPLAGWLYVVITRYAANSNGDVFPSIVTLAKAAKMSRASVLRNLKVLEEQQLIAVQRDTVAGKREREVNHYTLLSVTQVVSDSNQGGISQIPQVVSDSDYIKISTKDKDSSAPKRRADGEPKKPRAKHPNEDLHHAIVKAFGYELDELTRSTDSLYWKVAAELQAIHVSAEQIPKLAQALKTKATREGWKSYTVIALAKYAPELLKSSANDNIYADFDRLKVYTTVTEDERREIYGE